MEKNERIASSQLKSTITEHIKIMRWKNPHPKRAVNAKTVVVASATRGGERGRRTTGGVVMFANT